MRLPLHIPEHPLHYNSAFTQQNATVAYILLLFICWLHNESGQRVYGWTSTVPFPRRGFVL